MPGSYFFLKLFLLFKLLTTLIILLNCCFLLCRMFHLVAFKELIIQWSLKWTKKVKICRLSTTSSLHPWTFKGFIKTEQSLNLSKHPTYIDIFVGQNQNRPYVGYPPESSLSEFRSLTTASTCSIDEVITNLLSVVVTPPLMAPRPFTSMRLIFMDLRFCLITDIVSYH